MTVSENYKEEIRRRKRDYPSLTNPELGKIFGLNKSTISAILNESPLSGKLGITPEVDPELTKVLEETSEITEKGWAISLPKTDIHTLPQLIEYFEIDLSVWEVDKFQANKWAVGAKNGEGKIEVTQLFQVKAFLKRKQNIVDAKVEIEALKELAKTNASKPYTSYPRFSNTGNMLEVNIPDLHAGKLSWGEETGGANYDTKTAIETFNRALDTLLYRVREHHFDQVLFVLGNDLLNSDNQAGTTTGGTYVATDVRYQKTFTAVRDMKIEAIEKLRKIAPVKVVPISGNHDQLSVWSMGSSLECYFHKYNDVEVDNSPRFRKYHEFGKVMLMLTHGHRGKRPDYPLTMSTEEPEMFGRTRFREAHTGHKHGLDVTEYHGVRVRILSALCPEDAWHSENLYTGNIRSAEVFVWNKDEGLIGTAIYNELGNN